MLLNPETAKSKIDGKSRLHLIQLNIILLQSKDLILQFVEKHKKLKAVETVVHRGKVWEAHLRTSFATTNSSATHCETSHIEN